MKNRAWNLEIDHVSNMRVCILNTERQIKELGGKVVFATIATIATSSFHEWNFHRYSINKTDVLKFYEDYDEMQDRLHSVLREINQFITELNCKNNMAHHSYIIMFTRRRVARSSICSLS